MIPVKEYKTISEVAGPLMLIKQVEGVKYDELGEIELPDGSTFTFNAEVIVRMGAAEVNGALTFTAGFALSSDIVWAEATE